MDEIHLLKIQNYTNEVRIKNNDVGGAILQQFYEQN